VDQRYWLAFNRIKGIGATRVRRLLDAFGDLETAWTANAGALRDAGLDRRTIEILIAARSQINPEAELRRLEHSGAQAVTWADPGYPQNLLNIAQPPPLLFFKGNLLPADEWAVALVGTRHASTYGREVARELASGLAASGVTVVSGLARGVDVTAHRAALEAGGRTIAVLGSGVDNIYPPEHAGVAQQIAQAGAVVSDYALGTPPEASNFPPRNRIISGLSKGVVIVEAGEVSGALITADFAAEQGRDVFAVPGNIHQRTSLGPNKLIQQGAKMVTGVADILEELNLALVSEQRTARAALPADPTEQRLLACLSAEPVHIDELGVEIGLPIAQVSGALALMELKGLVRQVGGMQYVVAKEARASYSVD
jgi:DNA processing protein